LRSMKI